MGQFTIYNDGYAAYTAIPNLFIDEYMKDANDAQLKVYLYLIRMMSANRATSVSEIADKFNHTEKDVLRALKYWEKADLLSLDYDGAKQLTGIRLKDIRHTETSAPAAPSGTYYGEAPVMPSTTAWALTAEAPVMTTPISMQMPVMTIVSKSAGDTMQSTISKPQDSPTKVMYTKPSYSVDELKHFKEQESMTQLLFVAESYLKRPLTAKEMQSIFFFSDCLHFSDDLIDYLLQYCLGKEEKEIKNFNYIETVALDWAKKGVSTPQEAKKAAYEYAIQPIMKELGKNTIVAPAELSYIQRWTDEYGFSLELILEACKKTVLATDKNRFKYADKMLKAWKDENVHCISDIQRMEEAHKEKQRKNQNKKTALVSKNSFNQFSQRDYDFAELEAKLLSK